jgi:uncharacterized LabA/DUF88 family protein
MASSPDNVSMAVFCDFENVALGVRDANYDKFDIKLVLERLLLKGSIVVKKSYCDWDRYKGFKAAMHEANFELIEIPHVRQSGKNSADIRLVVDALDLCYTKSHVNTFVIISGDSDFSPLVSKLRENAKQVIGVGVKQSTSDLLVANCDEFIFYDDLVREVKRAAAKRDAREAQPAPKRSPDEGNRRKEELEARKTQAIDMAVETFDALVSERGDSGKIWASMLKEAIKRRKPDFSESYYGFRTFGNLLEEAQARGLLEFGRDDKSGAFVYRSSAAAAEAAAEQAMPFRPAALEQPAAPAVDSEEEVAASASAVPAVQEEGSRGRRNGRNGRRQDSGNRGAARGALPMPASPEREPLAADGARDDQLEVAALAQADSGSVSGASLYRGKPGTDGGQPGDVADSAELATPHAARQETGSASDAEAEALPAVIAGDSADTVEPARNEGGRGGRKQPNQRREARPKPAAPVRGRTPFRSEVKAPVAVEDVAAPAVPAEPAARFEPAAPTQVPAQAMPGDAAEGQNVAVPVGEAAGKTQPRRRGRGSSKSTASSEAVELPVADSAAAAIAQVAEAAPAETAEPAAPEAGAATKAGKPAAGRKPAARRRPRKTDDAAGS